MKAKVLKPIVPYSFEIGKIIEDAESLFGVAQTKNLIEQGYIAKMGTDIAEVEGLDSALSDRPVNTRVAAMIQNKMPTKTSELQDDSGFATLADLANATSGKVDKVAGKDLSSNDYTSADKSKLSGVAVNATANDTDANLKKRSNHSGKQSVSTIDGLSAVATTGRYNDLTDKPTIPTVNNPMAVAPNISMPLIALGGIYSFNVTIPGATTSMCAVINFPSGLLDSLASYSVNIEAANTVTVRLKAGIALAAGTRTFQIRVIP